MNERTKALGVLAILGSWIVGMCMSATLFIALDFVFAPDEVRVLQYSTLFGMRPPRSPLERMRQERAVVAVLMQMGKEAGQAHQAYQRKLVTGEDAELELLAAEKASWRFTQAYEAALYFGVIPADSEPCRSTLTAVLSSNLGLISRAVKSGARFCFSSDNFQSLRS